MISHLLYHSPSISMQPVSSLLPLSLNEYGSQITSSLPEPGSISLDQSAIVGNNSWIFLYKGSNLYYEGYLEEDQSLLAEKWMALIARREQRLSAQGITCCHVIVPNKASVLPDSYPFKLPRKQTDILTRILRSDNNRVLCPVSDWRDGAIANSIYRRNDSHLTIAGNAYLAELVFSCIDLPLVCSQFVETSSVEHVGDLGVKFNPGVAENFQAPSFSSGLLNQGLIQKTNEYIPSNGLNGTKQSFLNSEPVYNKSILIFGNSFFEKCPSWGITPIFSALFRETHFVWSADIAYEIVDRVLPDIVIAQTCERFLCRVPSN